MADYRAAELPVQQGCVSRVMREKNRQQPGAVWPRTAVKAL